jgi:hypothetical protein
MMKLLVSLVVAAVLTAAISACSDSDDDPDPTPTQPLATATSEPSAPEPTATTPSQPAPVNPTPEVPPTTPPETGDPDLDAIIQAVLDGDATALAASVALTTAPCTTAEGLGGPPKCAQALGSPPDGTEVEAFPVSSCELGWHFDAQPIVADFAARDFELFAVLALDLPDPLFNEPSMPELDHAIILESEAPGIGRLGHLVGVDNGSIVYLENVCAGAPEYFLTERPQIKDHHEINLRGPAFQ